MKKKNIHNECINPDEGFKQGDSYPHCEGEGCVNMAEENEECANMAADADATENGESGDESGVEPDAEIESLKSEVDEYRDKYLRLQAEFDNFRRRTLKEKMELVSNGGEKVLCSFLPVVDDVRRAVEAMDKSDDIEALRTGVRLIAQKFEDTLRKNGVERIESKGSDLDTDLHEAVAKFPSGDENRGKIIDVVQDGYKLGEKVLRFAKVVVGE